MFVLVLVLFPVKWKCDVEYCVFCSNFVPTFVILIFNDVLVGKILIHFSTMTTIAVPLSTLSYNRPEEMIMSWKRKRMMTRK